MAAKFNQFKDQLTQYLYTEKNQVINLLIKVEKQTQVKREYIALGIIGIIALYLIFGYGAQLICNIIAYVYPAMRSMKALESRTKEDDTRWLTYWVVFAAFSVVEFFSDILLAWFPLYWLAKCVFLTWCFAPLPWNGSDVIYGRVIRPLFLRHEGRIDTALDTATDAFGNLADRAAKAATKSD